ncbi:WLM-domain-containing protein [Pisolithus croceorrhizus]|nr:WLM-domain-containing protein [Pisolithus croceorrhizus]
MVHIRINEKKANPNPHVNFISDQARQVLEALAAQVKPIMKKHGFAVNSLEEYEFNHVFSGRNWNSGETIELVLRGASGSFLPAHWLMSTLCHELAHIKHMNHGPVFQDLWRRLRQEVRDLQNRGYFGDGYWSAGRRLADSAVVTGQGVQAGDLPEYMCGGAHSRVRPVRGRRSAIIASPSLHTGAQTTKKRKAGSRVTNSSAFLSIGKALNDDLDDDTKAVGTGFRKQAGSKRAREERALAAEKRIRSLEVKRDFNFDEDHVPIETDEDRRQTLLESTDRQELNMISCNRMIRRKIGTFAKPIPVGPSTSSESWGRPSSSSEHVNKKKRLLNTVSSPLSHKKQRTLGTGNSELSSHYNEVREPWSCLAINEPGHLACSACATPRDDF